MNLPGLAPSPVPRERVGERVVAMLQTSFIKTNLFCMTKQSVLNSVTPSFTGPLPSPAIKHFWLRKLPLQGQLVPQAQCMHCETPATPRVTGEGAAARFMETIRSNNEWLRPPQPSPAQWEREQKRYGTQVRASSNSSLSFSKNINCRIDCPAS